MLRPVPQGGTTAARAGTGAAAGEALVTGGAVVAAAGSVLLLCFTVKAIVDGEQTPIDIADKFYGTHFGDVSGWVQGRYPPKGSATPSTIEMEILIRQAPDGTVEVTTSAPLAQPESVSPPRAPPSGWPDAESDRESKNKRGRLYVTYRKLNKKTNLSDSRQSWPFGSETGIIMLMRTKTRRMLHLLKHNLMYSTMGLPSTTICGMMTQHTGGFVEESSN